MYHFASTYSSPGNSSHGSKSSTLNATQQKSSSDPFFLKIEEELHDARRVKSHGQEDDLRHALDMVISRVSELVRGPNMPRIHVDTDKGASVAYVE